GDRRTRRFRERRTCGFAAAAAKSPRVPQRSIALHLAAPAGVPPDRVAAALHGPPAGSPERPRQRIPSAGPTGDRRMRVLLLSPALLAPAAALADPPEPAGPAELHCGQLFDARSGRLLGPHTVQVRDGRIAAVRPGVPEAPAAGAVDLR